MRNDVIRPFINVTVPVYNEEGTLAENIGKIAGFLQANVALPYEIVIANNASTDGPLEIARKIEADRPMVRVLHLKKKGRGGAVKAAWNESKADILSYMDIDLSTELAAFPALIEPLISAGFDFATGSRLHERSKTNRGFTRYAESLSTLSRELFMPWSVRPDVGRVHSYIFSDFLIIRTAALSCLNPKRFHTCPMTSLPADAMNSSVSFFNFIS